MEQAAKIRHNITNISDISTFGSKKGAINNDCMDVYFVRAIGTNSNYLSDIQKLDDTLLENMNAGQGYYQRLNGLPRMQSVEDTAFYTKCYEDWVATGRKQIVTRSVANQAVLAGRLTDACIKLEALFKQENKQATDSIVKNFIVKLLFWYDSIFADERFHFDERQIVKIVASNIMKKQEYLFFYFVTLTGCDVLLLQSKADIAVEDEKLELSSKFVLGEFADVTIPAYQWRETRREQTANNLSGTTMQGQAGSAQTTAAQTGQAAAGSHLNSNGRITVKLPERNRPSKHPAQNPQSSTMQATTGGSNTGSTQPVASGNTDTQGNHRVVIPPRPGSNTGSTQPAASGSTGTQGNHRVVIPPRPGSNTGNTQPAASGSTTNSRATGGNPSRGSGRQVSITTPSRSTVPMAAGPEVEKSFEELAMLASSVVLITVYDGKGERLGSGSGIMIGKEGYILTNNHVAAGGRCFSVRIEDDEKEYRTDEIIKYHSVLDLAIIRIQRKLNPIPVYKGSKPLVRGQKVVAIGSPLGLFNSVSDGIISGFRKIDEVDMIQFTAPTSRGSSGGAVLNMQGEVIGISTAGIDAGQNINLAMGYECINMFIRGFI